MQEPDPRTRISLRLVSSNPFIRMAYKSQSLIRHPGTYEAFLRGIHFKAGLYKTDSKPTLRKLRNLNVR